MERTARESDGVGLMATSRSHRVLVLGSGGREHAMTRALLASGEVEVVYIMPGNPGMSEAGVMLCNDVTGNQEALRAFIGEHRISYVFPGSEKYLALGISNWCERWGVPCFGPSKEAAMLEVSKHFSKEILTVLDLPTPRFVMAKTKQEAIAKAREFTELPVVKVDGLASGKGVAVPKSWAELEAFVSQIFDDGKFGQQEVLLEERINGPEISVFFAVNSGCPHPDPLPGREREARSQNIQCLGACEDYKRLRDKDEGPNTGGMGSIFPHPLFTPELEAQATRIVDSVCAELARRGIPYRGFLFLGGMIVDGNLHVIEFNARLGDPEAESLLTAWGGNLFAPIIRKTSLPAYSDIAAKGAVATLAFVDEAYPESKNDSYPIGLDLQILGDEGQIYSSSVVSHGGNLWSNGGRVLYLTVKGATLPEALATLYRKVPCVSFEGMHYRTDIGKKWM